MGSPAAPKKKKKKKNLAHKKKRSLFQQRISKMMFQFRCVIVLLFLAASNAFVGKGAFVRR